VAHGDPGALLQGGRAGGPEGEDLEAGFVAADGGGERRAEEWGQGRARGVDALDLVYVRWVDGGGEGAEEEGGGGEGGGDGVVVESVREVSLAGYWRAGDEDERKKGRREQLMMEHEVEKGTHSSTSFGSPYVLYTSAFAWVYPYGPDLCLLAVNCTTLGTANAREAARGALRRAECKLRDAIVW